VPVDLAEQPRLDLRERDARRRDVQVRDSRGRMMSLSFTSGSVSTSYIDFSTAFRSMYDIVLLAWGSRSTRRVFMPFWAMAAARLMAVVVFPTPPF
jgi:hypothetical protein